MNINCMLYVSLEGTDPATKNSIIAPKLYMTTNLSLMPEKQKMTISKKTTRNFPSPF